MKRPLVLSVTALAATGVLTLAGCGSSGSTASHPDASTTTTSAGAPAAGPHNAADVRFASDMIPHHRQAVEMADMAGAQAANAQVKALAADITAAQDPEISRMTGWLAGWGSPVPSGSTESMGMGGTGMMSDADMTGLGAAHGAAFDRMWVQMMVQHHTGAVSMARTELSAGANTDAKRLAQSIVSSQTAQIAQLQTLFAQLPTA